MESYASRGIVCSADRFYHAVMILPIDHPKVRMNRFVLSSLVFALACVAGLAGCDGKSPSSPAKDVSPNTPDTPAGSSSTPVTLTLAVAASMKPATDEIIARFTQARPHIKTRATYGSSGSFFAQIQSGAPFDLFLSADTDYPRRIVEAKLAGDGDLFPYAVGRLVIWVHKDSPIDLEKLGLAALLEPSVRKIAIANPKLAPYGRAAEQAITSQGLMDRVKSKIVLGENIAQTAQYLETGAAEIGLIARSLAVTPAMQAQGRTWPVPGDLHETIAQSGVILNRTQHREAAAAFRDYLLSADGQAILAKHGFAPPSPVATPSR